MHRKWKSVSALGMAVLLGCLMPTNTILAAEDDTEVVQDVEADSVDDVISDDNESVDDEVNNIEEENADDEVNIDDDANGGIALMSETDGPEAGDVAVQSDAPVINIQWNGQNCIYDLGGKIDYKYVKDPDQKLELSASQDGKAVLFYYYLDKNPGDTAMGENQVNWSSAISSLSTVVEELSNNKTYVVYVKAEKDGKTVYARSCGIVVDTIAPKIGGVEEGNTYQEGTAFTVEDANLDVVMINGSPVTPEPDGSYRVRTEGASCVISAKDKAGNGTTCSITVSREALAENTVISKSGTYSLKADQKYQLAAGKWTVNGDSTVYQGGRTFYVKSAGNYSFTKR